MRSPRQGHADMGTFAVAAHRLRRGAIQQGQQDILEYADTFDYQGLHAIVSSPEQIKHIYWRCHNGYERLQVFHLLELDPSRFDLIPEYVRVE